ncbi:MAG: flagellar basal body P-ring protein FlgI [Planctomycetota bacterium]
MPAKTLKSLVLIAAVAAGSSAAALDSTRLANISRIKGQEENVLRGLGLVVGLAGTGATNDEATMRALFQAMDVMGAPVSATGRFDQAAREALRSGKSVSLVMVTATVPATGARSGDKLDCHISGVMGKSLVGGRLLSAALQGPNTQDQTVFATCEGPLQIEDPNQPMVAHIHNGCQMVRDIFTPFVSEDGWVTIVLDPHHANFNVAESVAYYVATKYEEITRIDYDDVRQRFVKPIDAANIRVKVPPAKADDHVAFVSDLLETEVYDVEPEARVICNTRTGSVVIGGNVEIGDVAFNHRNLVIETGNTATFLPIAPGETTRPKLERLLEALANLRVPNQDVIEIIRSIDRMGKLHAKLEIH